MTAYVVPIALMALGALALVLLVPRWRSRPPPGAPAATTPALSAADSARLDEELRRFGR